MERKSYRQVQIVLDVGSYIHEGPMPAGVFARRKWGVGVAWRVVVVVGVGVSRANVGIRTVWSVVVLCGVYIVNRIARC